MVKTWPDVIISDLEMPEMNGLEFLQYLLRNRPTPFIVFSNYTGSSAVSSLEALSQGAVDIIAKPDFSTDNLDETRELILNSIKAAANSTQEKELPRRRKPLADLVRTMSSMPGMAEKVSGREQRLLDAEVITEVVDLPRNKFDLIAIGSSTGGTTIIEKILRGLNKQSPGVVIVQHMPEHFTRAFAQRVNSFCEIDVKEAEDGDEILSGTALIAPGGLHMRVSALHGRFSVTVFDGDFVNRHRPSVDVLFNSVAEFVGEGALGVILTGMGKDGAKGLLAMRQRAALTIAQSEEDSVVYGMPKAAMALDAASYQLSAAEIALVLAKTEQR
jgi:two-component system chemotaxis response regulator CheB